MANVFIFFLTSEDCATTGDRLRIMKAGTAEPPSFVSKYRLVSTQAQYCSFRIRLPCRQAYLQSEK
jgi:hypothetical protein